MQDKTTDSLIAAFERHYDTTWDTPSLRNERLAWKACWEEATKPCLVQIQEPAPHPSHIEQPLGMVLNALLQSEAALEVAIARILKADPGHSISVTSEAKALVAVRTALSATSGAASPMPRLHIKELHGTTLPGGRVIGASTREYTVPAPAAVALSAKVIEALQMLENGALNVAENAKSRGDGYDEGYANAMAKMARETLAAFAATPAATESREELAHRLIGEVKIADAIATTICQRGAELGDRSSPEDWPEAMLVTGDELHLIAREAVIEAQETPAAAAPVVLPEPFALYDGEKWYANEEAAICSCANMQKLQKVYIEQQVRALLAEVSAPAAQAVEQAPVLYVSKGQLAKHRDPDGPDSTEHGRYLPARVTPAGKFTTPLFSAPQAQADARDALTPAALDVLAERARQISAEGWTPERDDKYGPGALSDAGGCYAIQAYGCKQLPEFWPWTEEWWKPSDTPRRNLEKAGALILAEIERIDRAAIAAAK